METGFVLQMSNIEGLKPTGFGFSVFLTARIMLAKT